jgi:acyl-coenzyme A thioesterase PaaI-like protein
VSRKQEIKAFLKQEFPQFVSKIEDVGERASSIRHHVTEADLRPGGTVSGPVLFAIADSGLYVAILGEIGIVPLAVTTNMNMNFLNKPSSTKDIIAKCKLIKVGRNLIVGEVYLYSEGNESPIAHAVGTYSIPPSRSTS